MRQVLIDKFVIPKNAIEEFIQRMTYNRGFIKNLPGFVQDAAYERTDENGDKIVVTVAVWQDEDAIKRAKEAVQAEYTRIGFGLAEMLARLNITVERATYNEVVQGR